MSKDVIDIDKVRGLIANRKKENKERAEALGEDVTVHITGDEFLNELQTSLVEGKLNPATAKVIAVNEATMIKDGERAIIDPKLIKHIEKGTNQNINANPTPIQYVQPIQQQDQNFYAEIERKQLELASLQGHTPQTGKPIINEQYIATPNALTEQVNLAFKNFLNEDLANVLQEAMKSSIVETYKAERVKSALQENKNMIRTIVIDVIKELQARNSKKKP